MKFILKIDSTMNEAKNLNREEALQRLSRILIEVLESKYNISLVSKSTLVSKGEDHEHRRMRPESVLRVKSSALSSRS